jgi:uncharacterized protein YndB with AHSA1/START domain
MARIKGEILIAQPPEVVFNVVADERNEPRYNPKMIAVRLVSDPPIGKGARFAATMRSRRRTFDMSTEFTEFERPTRLGSISTVDGMRTAGAVTFEPEDAGTRMSWSWTLELHGLMKFTAPLVAWMGRRQERAIYSGLKTHLEFVGGAVADQLKRNCRRTEDVHWPQSASLPLMNATERRIFVNASWRRPHRTCAHNAQPRRRLEVSSNAGLRRNYSISADVSSLPSKRARGRSGATHPGTRPCRRGCRRLRESRPARTTSSDGHRCRDGRGRVGRRG